MELRSGIWGVGQVRVCGPPWSCAAWGYLAYPKALRTHILRLLGRKTISYKVFGPFLGSPVVPFYPFSFWVPLLKPNSRKKGTLIIKGLLGNLDFEP